MVDWIDDEVLETLRRWVSSDLAADEDFLQAGGTSVALMNAVAELTESLGCQIELAQLLINPTARCVASCVRETRFNRDASAAIMFRRGTSDNAYVLILPDSWDLLHARDTFANLEEASVLLLPPFHDYSVSRPWLSLTGWAEEAVALVHRYCPAGSLVIGGFCSASSLAVEAARQLADRVRLLVLFEPDIPPLWTPVTATLATLLRIPNEVIDRPDVTAALNEAERYRLEGDGGKQRALEALRPIVMEHVDTALQLSPGTDLPRSLRNAMASRREGTARLVMTSHEHSGAAADRLPYVGECAIFVAHDNDSTAQRLQQDVVRYWMGNGSLRGDIWYAELGHASRGSRHPYLTAHHTILVHPIATATIRDGLRSLAGPDRIEGPRG